MILLSKSPNSTTNNVQTFRVTLDDGAQTTVYVARYSAETVHPKIVLFEEETNLFDWCKQNEILNAMSGGYFLRSEGKLLGDLYIGGNKIPTITFLSPWDTLRGSMYISPVGGVTLAPRIVLPQKPVSDLLQAGPLLVQSGMSIVDESKDTEGFSEGAEQFDDDISIGRFPRAAIATNRTHIFSVACDGYGSEEAGLTFKEFSDVLSSIGAINALNLDGGSSATIINHGKLINKPRGGLKNGYALFEKGRPIFSAILFEEK